MLPETMLHCIHCTNPAKSNCMHRTTRPNNLADNASGYPAIIWCSCWRMKQDRTAAVCFCEKDYFN
jgi:hypothetical protein